MSASGKLDFDHIFRAYDIRGIFGEDLTEEVAVRIGAGFAQFLDGKSVVVGRDVRVSGEKLREERDESLCRWMFSCSNAYVEIGPACIEVAMQKVKEGVVPCPPAFACESLG